MDKIDTIEYRGYNINIYPDDNCELPDKWENESFLVHYHRDFTVEDKRVEENEIRRWYQEGKCDLSKEYHIFGVEAYIHSGVRLALSYRGNFPDRGWDVSHVGAVLVDKKEAKLKKKAEKIAEGIVDTWNDCLDGASGYMIEREGEETGGCWGFYGYDNEKSGLLEHAHDEIDAELQNIKEKHAKQLRSWIKNRVPLSKRVFTV